MYDLFYFGPTALGSATKKFLDDPWPKKLYINDVFFYCFYGTEETVDWDFFFFSEKRFDRAM